MNFRNSLVTVAALLACLPAAYATTVITFDDIPEGTIASSQYNGVVIAGASVPPEASQLTPFSPPVSGSNVVYDYLDGTITLNFTTAVDSVGAFVTGNRPITLTAFDGATVLGTTTLPAANYVGAGTPNLFLELSFASITSATFSNGDGTPDTFTIDNLTVGGDITTNVPEPGNMGLLIAGLGVLGWSARRRKSA